MPPLDRHGQAPELNARLFNILGCAWAVSAYDRLAVGAGLDAAFTSPSLAAPLRERQPFGMDRTTRETPRRLTGRLGQNTRVPRLPAEDRADRDAAFGATPNP